MSDLLTIVDSALAPRAMRSYEGQAYQKPSLEVIGHRTRPVRTSRIPIVGRSLSLVAVVAQPGDVGLDDPGAAEVLTRLGTVMAVRHPPTEGLSLVASTIVVTREPIVPEDDAILARALIDRPRLRLVPLALFKVNLGLEALSFSLRGGPPGLFPEPQLLADALCSRLRRFVPKIEL